jgi:hypothetical protein
MHKIPKINTIDTFGGISCGMHLKIHQRKQEKTNVEIYRKAIEFFANELIPKKLQKYLHVSVTFKKFKGKEKKTEYGATYQVRKNSYKIEINSLKEFHHIISTLAHEMTHVAQGRKGRLVYTNTGFVWKKKFWHFDKVDATLEAHNEAPWEQEAIKNEKELTKRFFREVLVREIVEFDPNEKE